MKKILIILMLFIGIKISVSQIQIYPNDYNIVDKNIEYSIKDSVNYFKKIASLINDIPANATLISNCVSSFTSTNYGASAEGCGASHDNVDCNNSTNQFGGGADVNYTVENDIWYKFCPSNTGVWTMTVNTSSCSPSSNGFQISMFTGIPTNLITFLSSGPYPGYISAVVTLTLNVATCIYIQLDGYAGCKCNFSIKINNPICSLPIELISFSGEKNKEYNLIKWKTATEVNNSHFILERSGDAFSWNEVAKLPGAGNSLQIKNYSYNDYGFDKGINYYKLTQVDFNDELKSFGIIDIDNSKELPKVIRVTNLLGQEVSQEFDGPRIIFYEDGSVIKKTN